MSSPLDEGILPPASASSAVSHASETTFSAMELATFASGFERVRAQLPRMFQPFWHRWTYREEIPALLVYAENGRIALCLFRGNAPGGHIPDLEDCQFLHSWPPRAALHQVLQAAGLLQTQAARREIVLW